MDWGVAYEEHQRTTRDLLQRAKESGAPVVRLPSGPVDPRRLSYSEIVRTALRDAERIVNEAILREAEREGRRR